MVEPGYFYNAKIAICSYKNRTIIFVFQLIGLKSDFFLRYEKKLRVTLRKV